MVKDWSWLTLLTMYGPLERYRLGSAGSVFVSKPVFHMSDMAFSWAFAGFGALASPRGMPLSRSTNALVSVRPAFLARTCAGMAMPGPPRAISQSAKGLEYLM